MRCQHVCVDAFSYVLPPHVVTSEQIERQLAPLYERLGLPEGRLELMTGIRERRFFDSGVLPGTVSAETAAKAIDASGIDRRHIGAVVHGSVCAVTGSSPQPPATSIMPWVFPHRRWCWMSATRASA